MGTYPLKNGSSNTLNFQNKKNYHAWKYDFYLFKLSSWTNDLYLSKATVIYVDIKQRSKNILQKVFTISKGLLLLSLLPSSVKNILVLFLEHVLGIMQKVS